MAHQKLLILKRYEVFGTCPSKAVHQNFLLKNAMKIWVKRSSPSHHLNRLNFLVDKQLKMIYNLVL